MKALTLWQPWASAIPLGLKCAETRSWSTSYRGPLAIHSAKKSDTKIKIFFEEKVLKGSKKIRNAFLEHGIYSTTDLPFGYILATCQVIDCIPVESFKPTELERVWGDYSPNRFVWLLEDITPLKKPIPYRGAQGFWNWK